MKNPKNKIKYLTLNPKVGMTISFVDGERVEIFETTRYANSSNLPKLKLVLNKFDMACIVLNTCQRTIVGSTDCLTPSSDVKNSWELQGIVMQ